MPEALVDQTLALELCGHDAGDTEMVGVDGDRLSDVAPQMRAPAVVGVMCENVAGRGPAVYHWCSVTVDTEAARRALVGVDATREPDSVVETYTLGNCEVDLFSGELPVLLISGPTADAVCATARRLGYLDGQGTVTTVRSEVPLR